jgi:hypothetical protein
MLGNATSRTVVVMERYGAMGAMGAWRVCYVCYGLTWEEI